MSSRRTDSPSTELLAAYLEGELSGSDRRAVDRQLQDDGDARRRREQLQMIRNMLKSPLVELRQVDLTNAVMRAVAAQPELPRHKGGSTLAAAVVLSAAACFAAVTLHQRELDADFRAKGAHLSAPQKNGEAALQVYTVGPHNEAPPLVGAIAHDAGLVFSYVNRADAAFSHLMVFAVDADRQVRWYYPPFDRADTDPSSIAVHAASDRTMLPDVIRHDLAGGPMVIYALFTNEPLHVYEVERWLSEQHGAPEEAPQRNALLLRMPTTVTP